MNEIIPSMDKVYITINDAHLNSTGVGVHTQYLIRSLIELGVNLRVNKYGPKFHSNNNTIDHDVKFQVLGGVLRSPSSLVLTKEDRKHVNIRIGTLGEIAFDAVGGNIAYLVYENLGSTNNIKNIAAVFSLYDHIFVPAETFAKEIREYFPSESHRVHVLHEGSNQYFYIDGYDPPKNTFAVVGKFEKRKGHHALIEVLREWNGPEITLNLYCENPWDKDGLLNKLTERSLGNCIVIRHSRFDLSHELIEHILCNNRYAIMPSYSEGWGLPILDCMKMGMPTITHDSTGMSEYLPYYKKACYLAIGDQNFYKEFEDKTILKSIPNQTMPAADGKFFKDGHFPYYLNNDLREAIEFMVYRDPYSIIKRSNPDTWNDSFRELTWINSTRRFVNKVKELYGARFTS